MAESEKRKLERTITFRLPETTHNEYLALAKGAGLSIGAVVRQCLVDARPTLVVTDQTSKRKRALSVEELERMAAAVAVVKKAKPDKTPDSDEAREVRRRLLFLANKTSNNMNQLAHRANAAHQAGTIDRQTYEAILYELQSLSDAMKKGVGDVS